jgi:hypothetical protein
MTLKEEAAPTVRKPLGRSFESAILAHPSRA